MNGSVEKRTTFIAGESPNKRSKSAEKLTLLKGSATRKSGQDRIEAVKITRYKNANILSET